MSDVKFTTHMLARFLEKYGVVLQEYFINDALVGRYMSAGDLYNYIYPKTIDASEDVQEQTAEIDNHKEKKFSKTEMLKKPWKWQKKVYESMDRHLEAAIENVTKLSMDVQRHEMEKMWDEMYEKNSKELMEVAQVAETMSYGDKEIRKGEKSR